jgi:hypothetical protein
MVRFLSAILLVSAACGGDDGDGDHHHVDANLGDTCLPGTYDVDAEWPFDDAPYAITGTVTFPATLSSGRAVQIEVIKVDPFPFGNYLQPVTLTADKSTLTYRARSLPDGTWTICLRADVNGNGMVGDAGTDYIGCFDGTTGAPIKMSSAATTIALVGMCQAGRDFGVGVQ